MGRPAGWMKELTGRSPMKSPGAPSHRREIERAFWIEIARGLSSENAATAVGVSQAVGARWFRHRGGMSPFTLAPLAGRFLSFAEREEIALLRVQGTSVRGIARSMGRSASTISRELRRNAATRGGKLEYRASVAQWKSELVAQRPKTVKLLANDRLRDYVQDRLSGAVKDANGVPIFGPATQMWKGRNKPHRQDRRPTACRCRGGAVAEELESPADQRRPRGRVRRAGRTAGIPRDDLSKPLRAKPRLRRSPPAPAPTTRTISSKIASRTSHCPGSNSRQGAVE